MRRRRPIPPSRPSTRWTLRPRALTSLHPSETGGAPAAAAAPADHAIPASAVAALFAGHILRDGELVLLVLRPSRWFILLSSLRFLAIAAILMILGVIFDDRIPGRSREYVEIGIFFMAGRLMWAILQWMGRLYVLTDLRILRLSGVFGVDVFDCALRKVARTILDVEFKERLFRTGSIVIIPQEEDSPLGHWQTIPHPRRVHEKVVATINRAKQGCLGGFR